MKVVLVIEFNLCQCFLISKGTITLKRILLTSRSLLVVHFWAPWAPQCAQMNDVMAELAKEQPRVSFVKVCLWRHVRRPTAFYQYKGGGIWNSPCL